MGGLTLPYTLSHPTSIGTGLPPALGAAKALELTNWQILSSSSCLRGCPPLPPKPPFPSGNCGVIAAPAACVADTSVFFL